MCLWMGMHVVDKVNSQMGCDLVTRFQCGEGKWTGNALESALEPAGRTLNKATTIALADSAASVEACVLLGCFDS